MARRARRSTTPIRGAALLDQIFERAGLAREARDFRLLAAWAEVAGVRLGAHARAERVHGTTLVVRVKSSGWAQQLSMMRAELLAGLHAQPGGMSVRELRFSVGPLDELPSWDDDSMSSPRSAPVDAPLRPLPTPLEDGQVTAALLRVQDAPLRANLAELYARCRSRR